MHYLVRLDAIDDSKPASLVVASLDDMGPNMGCCKEERPPCWAFFDTEEDRDRFNAWVDEASKDRTPRVVSISKQTH
jgi:hypothetical protein